MENDESLIRDSMWLYIVQQAVYIEGWGDSEAALQIIYS